MAKQIKENIQELERDISESYMPIYTIKTGTHKKKKIKKATAQISTQYVKDICLQRGFSLSEPQAYSVAEYLFLLQKWNQSMNLVGKESWQDILSELIIDSFHLARFLNEEADILPQDAFDMALQKKNPYTFQTSQALDGLNEKDTLQIWDLGSGAGLPGIPLRFVWQYGQCHLVEARQKRSMFLNTCLVRLSMSNTKVFHGRAEDFMADKQAHCIISRAFMPFEKMLPFVAPYVKQEFKWKEENKLSQQGKIIFLSLEKLNASLYSTDEYSFETHKVTSYSVQKQKRYICSVTVKSKV